MAALYLHVALKIYQEHPSLKSEVLGGPCKIDETTFNPRLYVWKE